MSSPSSADGPPGETAIRRMWQSPFAKWLLLSLLWIVLAVISAVHHAALREIEWNTALTFTLLDWGPWIVLSPIVLWFARRVQIDGRNWLRTVPLHIVGAIATALAGQWIAEFATDYRIVEGPGTFRVFVQRGEERPAPRTEIRVAAPREPRELHALPSSMPRFIRTRFSIPIYCVLVAAAHAFSYHRRGLERERRALLAESRLTEARLMALQTQLNPHFLFNTLNAVSSLVYTQPRAADEMICALSELLRRVLATSERRQVTLAEELEFIDHYIGIQRIRFSDRLEVRREIEPGLERVSVPTLILQPLVENAIIHGIAPRAARGVVTVKAVAAHGRLFLTVCDTGSGGTTAPPRADGTLDVAERVGLTNTRARLAAMYGGDAHFTLTRATEGGLCARIDLPLRQAVIA